MKDNWSDLNNKQKHEYGKHYAKMQLTMHGFKVKDLSGDAKDCDFIAEHEGANYEFLVRVVSSLKNNYLIISNFKRNSNFMVVLISNNEGENPCMYVFRGDQWPSQDGLLTCKSNKLNSDEYEYGINISKKTEPFLGNYYLKKGMIDSKPNFAILKLPREIEEIVEDDEFLTLLLGQYSEETLQMLRSESDDISNELLEEIKEKNIAFTLQVLNKEILDNQEDLGIKSELKKITYKDAYGHMWSGFSFVANGTIESLDSIFMKISESKSLGSIYVFSLIERKRQTYAEGEYDTGSISHHSDDYESEAIALAKWLGLEKTNLSVYQSKPQLTEFLKNAELEGIVCSPYTKDWYSKQNAADGYDPSDFDKFLDSGDYPPSIEGHIAIVYIDIDNHDLKEKIIALFPSFNEAFKKRMHHPDFLIINQLTDQAIAVGLGRKNRLFAFKPGSDENVWIWDFTFGEDKDYIYEFTAQDPGKLVYGFISSLCHFGEASCDWLDLPSNPETLQDFLDKEKPNNDGYYEFSELSEPMTKEEINEIIEKLIDADTRRDKYARKIKLFFPNLDNVYDLNTGDC